MEPNIHSSVGPGAGGRSDWLVSLTAAVDALDAEDLTGLPDATLAEQLLELRRLVDRLEGQWRQRLAAVDARGAAGAEQGIQVGSTAAWLRRRLHVGAGAAASLVRTARALFRGPLTATAAALTAGEITTAHAAVVAHGTRDLPAQVVAEAEPVLVEAAGRLDPPRLRRVLDHLQQVTDPDGADRESERRHQRRGLWLAPTWEGMVALHGLLDPEGATPCWPPWSPSPVPPTAKMAGAGISGAPMPWSSWPAATSRAAGSPRPVGCGPTWRWSWTCTASSTLTGRWLVRWWPARWLGGAAGPGGLSAAGLRRRGHPSAGRPPAHPRTPRPRPRRRRGTAAPVPIRGAGGGGAAAGGDGLVAAGPGRRRQPTPGGWPHHQGRHPRPAHRAGRP
jgi:hypothetical protein